jgi:hypothetical protein
VAVTDVLDELKARGVEVVAVGDKLRWHPASAVPPALRQRIIGNKPALLELLGQAGRVAAAWKYWDAVTWPARCLESEQLFGQRHARLFPLIKGGSYPGAPTGWVMTSRGPGKLLAVAADVCLVALDEGPKRRATFLPPNEVWPDHG